MKYIFFLVSCIMYSVHIQAQSFVRIETEAGLGVLEENNGVAIADYDKDGDLDVFVVALGKDENNISKSHSRLFSNNNDGTFLDVTAVSGLLIDLFPANETGSVFKNLEGVKYGAFWGDYDNDGFPDLFLTNVYKIYLFHNEGNATFLDVTAQAGFTKNSQCVNTDATWFDYNKDGFLDLYISDWEGCEGNSLHKNNGDGTFSDVSNVFGTVENKQSFMSIPFDFNNDGWLDLYVANDNATKTNDLFINSEGIGFTEQASNYGLDHAGDDMGITIGDYNNDGFFDIYVTAITTSPFLVNNGENKFNNLAVDQGISYTGWAWDTIFSDFDLDGDEDLFIVNGFDFGGNSTEKNIYYENLLSNDEIGFRDSSAKTNLDAITMSTSAGVFDYDNDGDLDIFVTNTDRASYFYENKITDFILPTPNLNWFKVNLEGTTSNRDAIGATLTLTTNKETIHRYYTGKGFLSQNLKSVHFGIGSATEIKSLKISWPSGLVEIYNNLPINKSIKTKEGFGYEVLISTPSKKIYGCIDPNACNYNPNATISSGECIYIESQTISGKTVAVNSSSEFYSYSLLNGSIARWNVEGGEIEEGENGSTIKVKWGTGETGSITVVESNASCSSEPVILFVKLGATSEENTTGLKSKSIARLWNDALLKAIRRDYARPTVHARNLFHTSIAMYDAWSIYSEQASPYLLGNDIHEFSSSFEGFKTTEALESARKKTISYAAYRLLVYRFKDSPNLDETLAIFDDLMEVLGYNTEETTVDYSTGNPIALGNYIAENIIAYGHSDGANEINKYDNLYYEAINPALVLNTPEESEPLVNPNRWQPLSFNTFIDQSGNLITESTPDFLGPEWGNVNPFSLKDDEKTSNKRSGNTYTVYHDPGLPPYLNTENSSISSEAYKWGFSLVSQWSSHLNPKDGVLWDISPKSIGNIKIEDFPTDYSKYSEFYKESGGDISKGHAINPYTKKPYESQLVPRGDYTRVLAEFWADGPDSETPPGHWFTLLNYVSDHDLLVKKINGKGDLLNALEWDVKSYFIMGGAMHDSAIAAWSIKGWYDYIRPISAIRYMAGQGQSTDPIKANYNISGIPLKPGYIELVEVGDALAGDSNEHLGKIKLYSWKGHDYIEDIVVDQAGVDWVLSENWWPYQRPSFVTPPFAGYVSGHSTYSRAAAEVMTLLTGDAYFPGGYGEFIAKKNEFLVFEEGPSVDVKLQWATYRDASDQCSLSRIWGGIHPPADDIPGRLIGEQIGQNAFHFGSTYFQKEIIPSNQKQILYPNPVNISVGEIVVSKTLITDNFSLYDINGRLIQLPERSYNESKQTTLIKFPKTLIAGIYILKINTESKKIVLTN